VAEDRALLGSTPSTAPVQGHGRCPCGIALSFCHASGLKRKIPGARGQRPRRQDQFIVLPISSSPMKRFGCTSHVNAPPISAITEGGGNHRSALLPSLISIALPYLQITPFLVLAPNRDDRGMGPNRQNRPVAFFLRKVRWKQGRQQWLPSLFQESCTWNFRRIRFCRPSTSQYASTSVETRLEGMFVFSS